MSGVSPILAIGMMALSLFLVFVANRVTLRWPKVTMFIAGCNFTVGLLALVA